MSSEIKDLHAGILNYRITKIMGHLTNPKCRCTVPKKTQQAKETIEYLESMGYPIEECSNGWIISPAQC